MFSAPAGMAGIVLDRGVEPEPSVLLDGLRCPGVRLRPLEGGHLHDRAMVGPGFHVGGGIDEPLAHVEHLVALRLVMPRVEIQPVAHDQRGRVGGELVADDGIRAGRSRLSEGRMRPEHPCGQEHRHQWRRAPGRVLHCVAPSQT